MLTRQRQDEILELLHNEVKPALGCTEPMAVSLAVARACERLRAEGAGIEKVEVAVSANILKNGMGVGIPGVGMVGLHIASALAVTCGKSAYGLEVLKDLDEGAMDAAKAMVREGRISVSLADTDIKLYISALCSGGGHCAQAVIRDDHDNFVMEKVDGRVLYDTDSRQAEGVKEQPHRKGTLDYHLDVRTIYEFATTACLDDISFMMDAARYNSELAEEGLKGDYGLRVGKTLESGRHSNVFGNGLVTRAMALTAAASDARMAGCTLPAMSNSGSGNQGITVTMPVVTVAGELGSTDEQLTRALTLSHLIAIHIKGYLGKLSALCGCVIASTGSSCGIVMLNGGTYEQICYSIKNMVGDISGMMCDGAKLGCALKVASGVSAAVQSAVLALDNICIAPSDGIIEDDVEKTIRNLGSIGSKGMQSTDRMILDIMICK